MSHIYPLMALDAADTLAARCARMEAALHRLAAPATAVMVEPGQGREWLVMRLRTELADRRAIAQEALR
jgi:hypothetical protein